MTAKGTTKASGPLFVKYSRNHQESLVPATRDLVMGEIYAYGGYVGYVKANVPKGAFAPIGYGDVVEIRLNGITEVPNSGDALWYKEEDQTIKVGEPTSEKEKYVFLGFFYLERGQAAPTSHDNLEGLVDIVGLTGYHINSNNKSPAEIAKEAKASKAK